MQAGPRGPLLRGTLPTGPLPTGPLPTAQPDETEAWTWRDSRVIGLAATAFIHVGLVAAVLISSLTEGRTKPRPVRERVINTQIIEIQAGSPEGRRTKGKAYRRKKGHRQRRYRRNRRKIHLGGARRSGPRRNRQRIAIPDDGEDDAVNVPSSWGSQTGIDAPMGAGPADDRHGAGGTAEKGALDPCFTQHAQVVASYRAKVAAKIPRFKRPAFISADVAANLSTVVRVSIDAAGKVTGVRVARPSGNPSFDGAATAHVQAVGSFPAPHKCVMYDKLRGRFLSVRTFTVTIKP
jgi:TonB family protein